MRLLNVFATLLTAAVHPAYAESINFDHSVPGSLPVGWSVAMTHQGGPPKWKVLEDASAPSRIVRANALEDNVVLYKVENGERVSLSPKGAVSNTYGVKHKVPKQTWTTLRVDFRGALFSVTLDGQKLFDVEDSTFMGAGKTGLWTKSDSVIYFDDFQVSQERKK